MIFYGLDETPGSFFIRRAKKFRAQEAAAADDERRARAGRVLDSISRYMARPLDYATLY